MRYIAQETSTDCGVAALAMLAGVTLNEARDYLVDAGFKVSGVKAKAIVAGLKHFGREPLRASSIRLASINLNRLADDALLSCWLKVDEEWCGHWAVWDARGRRVLDPYVQHGAAEAPLRIRTYLPVKAR
ncbi:hypothetical protein [Sphingomonas spermidinifaciens]|uniref:hypothetical protein n=1 Tax=Sphingomonas spermidinifaciens TaxID=1141889 RepID=UPI001142DBDE|nr:hypothetical protein [Sphingomonas spermidinifaciens]